MKTTYTSLLIIAGLFSVIFLFNACAKPDNSAILPKEQQVVGTWSINRIQLKIYINGTFMMDTILKQTPNPVNYVSFDANGGFEYKFNTASADVGSYEFAGGGALITNSTPRSYNWTTLTLTNKLFTVVSKEPDPAFPGALVERYQTFVR
ncbi:MAG: hypothetical protein IPG38_11325 [Chitinophagaceae bacterium]|nr:hypothetical protein [Chitinophagaceae bacterium]